MESKQFGSLLVTERCGSNKHGQALWKCKCDCGNTHVAVGSLLRSGKVKSCGCLHAKSHAKRRMKAGMAGLSVLFSGYKTSASRRGHSFELTLDQFQELTAKRCRYCDALPTQVATGTRKTNDNVEHSKYIYNGLDRIDPQLGYVITNVVPCCYTCNKAKSIMNLEQFKQWIIAVYTHINGVV